MVVVVVMFVEEREVKVWIVVKKEAWQFVVLPTCSGSGRRQRPVMSAEPGNEHPASQCLRLIDTT
jgi:hypothetical protein